MTYLILVGRSHALDDLFRFRFGDVALIGDNLGQDGVDFTGHVGGVTADVEIRLLF